MGDLGPRLCRLCQERPVPPSRLRDHDYRCSRCRHRSPSQRASTARYFKSEKRRAVVKKSNQQRIAIGRIYHSRVKDVEMARTINAHIKERRLGFVKGQSDREEAEGATEGRIQAETAV
jgi:hypothetical protein